MYVKGHTTDFKTLEFEPNFQFNYFEIPYIIMFWNMNRSIH